MTGKLNRYCFEVCPIRFVQSCRYYLFDVIIIVKKPLNLYLWYLTFLCYNECSHFAMTCMSRLLLNNSGQFNSYPAFVFFVLSLLTLFYILNFFISLFQTFSGNKDRNTLVEHLLVTAFNARFIRFHPKTYYGYTCLRAEVYGCRNGTLISLVWFKLKLLSAGRVHSVYIMSKQ